MPPVPNHVSLSRVAGLPFPGWDFRIVSSLPTCGTGLPATSLGEEISRPSVTRGVSGLRAVLVNLGWRVTGPPDPHSEPRVNMRSYPSVALLLTFNSCAKKCVHVQFPA